MSAGDLNDQSQVIGGDEATTIVAMTSSGFPSCICPHALEAHLVAQAGALQYLP